MPEIKRPAAFFDVDGTLHDNFDDILRTFEKTLDYYGLESKSREAIRATVGLPLGECYKILVPKGNVELLCQTHRDIQESGTSLVVPFPKALDSLEKLRTEGVKTAAITARGRESAMRNMKKTGVAQMMDYIVTDAPKPSPKPIYNALSALRAEASDSFMTGDSPVDIIAGKEAGTNTIAATYGFFSKAELEQQRPDFTINEIAEVVPIILFQMSRVLK